MNEVLKEAKLMQHNLEFCGLGFLPIVHHIDVDVARVFCHERGVGRVDCRRNWRKFQGERRFGGRGLKKKCHVKRFGGVSRFDPTQRVVVWSCCANG